MDQIKKRQQQLEADQKAWQTKKIEIEQEVARNNTVLDVLSPKVTATQTELKRLRGEIDSATETKTELIQEIIDLKATNSDLSEATRLRKAALGNLDELISAMQAKVDDELAAYAREQKAKLDTQLAELVSTVQAKTDELSGVQDRVDEKRQELADVLGQLTEQRATALQETGEASERLRRLRTQLPELEAKLGIVERQYKQASYQRDQILAEMKKAKLEHQNFLDYEAKARKLLATKDRELQDRRDELEVTGRHLNARKSFLSEL